MSNKPSICFVLPSLAYGGAELQTIQHINAFKDEYNVFLIILSNVIVPDLFNRILINSDNILLIGHPSNTPDAKSTISAHLLTSKILKFLKAHDCKIVVANLPLSHLYMRLVKIWANFTGYKFKLINYHRSLQFSANPVNTFSKKAFHRYNAFLAQKADDVNLFISKACLEDISAFLPVANPVVIHNSVPYNPVPPNLAMQYLKEHQLASEFLIVVPGRLHPSKGHRFFIDAFNVFLNEQKITDPIKIRVVFAGGNILEDELRAYIEKLGLSTFIHITGTIANNALLSFLRAANLVVIPSIHEGFGNIVIEALMQEGFVLASDAGGIPEIIHPGTNGYLFKKLDQEDLVKKLTSVFEGNLTLDKSFLRQDFMNRFSFEAHKVKLKALFSEQLAKF